MEDFESPVVAFTWGSRRNLCCRSFMIADF